VGHFYYNLNGVAKPLWEVPYADKKKGMRAATLADAKKVNGKPSPNTIMDILAKPGLIRWSDNLLMDAATAALALSTEYDSDWKTRALELHKAMRQAKADLGTEIHEEIEKHLRKILGGQQGYNPERGDKWQKVVESAINWLFDDDEQGSDIYIENESAVEKYFVNDELGFGGMIDLVGCDEGRPVIVDWKTIDTKGKRFNAYPKDKCPLLAAYAMGYFGTLEADCFNVFLSRDEPGVIIPMLYSEAEIATGWAKFQLCYELWVLDKGHDPRENNG